YRLVRQHQRPKNFFVGRVSAFAGGAVGAPAFGWVADRYGRQIALQVALAVSSLAMFTAFSLALPVSLNLIWVAGPAETRAQTGRLARRPSASERICSSVSNTLLFLPGHSLSAI
ncbi:MAG: transporter, partial [Tardiphaga sp.]|nr:transporter [Tardiphaga sp.]